MAPETVFELPPQTLAPSNRLDGTNSSLPPTQNHGQSSFERAAENISERLEGAKS
jgi:hypothetical protein